MSLKIKNSSLHPAGTAVVRKRDLRSTALAAPPLLFLALFFVLPLCVLFAISLTTPVFGLQNYQKLLGDSTYFRVLGNTFTVSATVTIVALLIGYPVAWLLAIMPSRGARILLSIILISMWTNLIARTYAWMVLLQNTGAINRALINIGLIDRPLPLINNLFAVVVGMTYIMLPFVILPIRTTMMSIDPSMMKAASLCGARPYQVFFRVLLPLSMPGIGAAALMVFVMTLGYYVTPSLLGGASNIMLGEMVAQQMLTLLDWGLGSAAAFLLLAIALALYAVFVKFFGLKAVG
ncbi:ABC transporter permease [Rhizobium sp. 2MFCol3.1]|uniref:ABC transporter permease n=1 Tax=Rhizobium sp. 2MFCol3.1 TaxID=1246459 RepID=UPI0003761CEB|nr:ABC transporter permease [Rhizobium sp. 2MFCol3.1]